MSQESEPVSRKKIAETLYESMLHNLNEIKHFIKLRSTLKTTEENETPREQAIRLDEYRKIDKQLQEANLLHLSVVEALESYTEYLPNLGRGIDDKLEFGEDEKSLLEIQNWLHTKYYSKEG